LKEFDDGAVGVLARRSEGKMLSRLPSGRRRYNMRWFRLNATMFLTVLAMGLSGCCLGIRRETISTVEAKWQGKVGIAFTVTQSEGTKKLEGAQSVSFKLCRWGTSEFREPTDFTVPVIKIDPRAITLFFSTDYSDLVMLGHLPSEFREGRVTIVGCHPGRVCE
jgi:hypothetical protein